MTQSPQAYDNWKLMSPEAELNQNTWCDGDCDYCDAWTPECEPYDEEEDQ